VRNLNPAVVAAENGRLVLQIFAAVGLVAGGFWLPRWSQFGWWWCRATKSFRSLTIL
jgi:hypothetical protein